MENNFEVGIVWGVNGTNVVIKMYDISSDFKYFYNGEEYEGVRTGGYLSITRGHIDIICQIESEEIKDNFSKLLTKEENEKILNKERYERFVYAKCIGYFENNVFKTGVKYSPVIYNIVKMMSENTVKSIFSPKNKSTGIPFIIGKDIKYELDMDLPWEKIFNTHIGIFGNTGSGKSNTLTKLYNILLNHPKLNLKNSEFVFIDFNGEYTGNKVFCENKKIFKLNTLKPEDKFPLNENSFWNEEVLGILFHVTEKTQKPFLKALIKGRNKYKTIPNSLENYIKKIYIACFETTNPKKEFLEILHKIFKIIDIQFPLNDVKWNTKLEKFYIENPKEYFNEGKISNTDILKISLIALNKTLDFFEELEIRGYLGLLKGLLINDMQYEHINPLLNRINSTSESLKKIMKVSNKIPEERDKIRIISLRNCNQEIKKLFPILLAREFFEEHKRKVGEMVDKTFHLIIDEAHNILSHQSNREAEIWKDYRLELFEEIIKEGRKFGFFLTVSSQRPADISETIMSQFHNFFIHRLINEKDLRLIDNVISTLDSYSKGLIPTLPQGACILTGTAFDFPQIIQVKKIKNKDERPNSDDIDLRKLWKK